MGIGQTSRSILNRLGRGEILLGLLGIAGITAVIMALEPTDMPRPWGWIAAGSGVWALLALAGRVMVGARWGTVLAGVLAMLMGLIALLPDAIRLSPAADLAPRLPWQLEGRWEWLAAIAAVWLGWLGVQLARLRAVWRDLETALTRRGPLSEAENRHRERGFAEHFAYLILTLFVLTALAYGILFTEAAAGNGIDEGEVTPIFLFCLVSAFAPLTGAFWRKGKLEAEDADTKFLRDDVVSNFSFAVMAAAVAGVTLLAIVAARYATQDIEAQISFATFGFVLALFVSVIVAPHIRRALRNHRERQVAAEVPPAAQNAGFLPLEVAATATSYIDSALVRLVAPLSGATQKRLAHANVIAIMTLLSALGFITPRPWGLVPIMAGILFAVALGRRWAWVEADRETASRLQSTRGKNIHLGFENDLKDEALLGYAGLFVLVPLTLYQLQDITNFVPDFVTGAPNLMTWVAFFGGELAKAVPFVDWWDIYSRDGVDETGKHLTFIARAMVDLVILAALFQALGIWQRNKVQERLYAEGHLDAFDPFKEQEFFERGLVRLSHKEDPNCPETVTLSLQKEGLLAWDGPSDQRTFYRVRKDFADEVEAHFQARRQLLKESSQAFEAPSPYSQRRLGELLSAGNGDLRAGSAWMVRRYGVLVGTPLDRLEQLAQKWAAAQFPDQRADRDVDAVTDRRTQKLELERILAELADRQWVELIRRHHLFCLTEALLRVRKDDEFDFARILAFEIFARLRTEYAVLFLARFVLEQRHYRAEPQWGQRMTISASPPEPAFFLGRAEMRGRVYNALAQIACNRRAGDSARKVAASLLDWMADDAGDRSQGGRKFAADGAERARDCLQQAGLLNPDGDV